MVERGDRDKGVEEGRDGGTGMVRVLKAKEEEAGRREGEVEGHG